MVVGGAAPVAGRRASDAGTSSTGPGGWTAAKPSESSAARTTGHPRTWAVSTAPGTGAAPGLVPGADLGGGHVERDGEAGHVGPRRQLAASGPEHGVEAERVDHGREAAPHAVLQHGVQEGERILRRGEVVLALADERPEAVAGHHLIRGEPSLGPGRLAGRRRPDQHHEAGGRQRQRLGHARATLGGPSAGPYAQGMAGDEVKQTDSGIEVRGAVHRRGPGRMGPGRAAGSPRPAAATPAASTRRCTGAGCGRCGSTPGSARRRPPTSGSSSCSTPARRACPAPSTCRPRWATTPTTRAPRARSGRSAWPSTPSRTCACSWAGSRSTRSRRR